MDNTSQGTPNLCEVFDKMVCGPNPFGNQRIRPNGPIFIISDNAMGDSIMAHAAMQQVLRNRPEWTTSYQQAANLEVSLIMRPQLHCRSLLDLPACNMAPLIHFGINTILFDDKRRMHPINHFLELCGMAQDETPQPEYSPVYMWQPHQGEFAPERPIPSYDFIIAPFSNATRMDEPRMLEFSHYPYLFAQLGRMYTGPAAR